VVLASKLLEKYASEFNNRWLQVSALVAGVTPIIYEQVFKRLPGSGKFINRVRQVTEYN